MRARFVNQAVLAILLLCQLSICLGKDTPDANDTSKYLDAVREFADNVLKYGRDTYGPKHTPLFVDGLNIHTHEPVKWIDPDGTKWILSNLASQQTLLRTLDGLSEITGDPKYHQAATDAIKYAFDHLRTADGLFHWGQATTYDASGDTVRGTGTAIKLHYPYYELMWKVDPEATKKLIEAIWCAHVIDWSNLDFCRGINYSNSLEEPWDHKYQSGPPLFNGKGIGMIKTGSFLVHAGIFLHKQTDQEQPLIWSKRLVKRFVNTRHPKTGISATLYNQISYPLGDDLREHFKDPRTVLFPYDIPKNNEYYYPEKTHSQAWTAFLLTGKMVGIENSEFIQWALEELTAWGKVAYRRRDNSFIPMLTDGTSLEGYVVKEHNRLGPEGTVIKPYVADLTFLWAYSVAYNVTGDEFMWKMVRDIALGNHFGDVGENPTSTPRLRNQTDCSDAYGLLSFLELYARTENPEFLRMARCIGDKILETRFYKGYFVLSRKHIYTRFDSFEPLVLLHLASVIESRSQPVPQVWPSSPLFVGPYRYRDKGIDRQAIYPLTESSEPPVSLQEAGAINDLQLLKALIKQGHDIDGHDDPVFRTALHRATINNHKEAVELLLVEGANVNARDSFGSSALHYAAQNGHKEVAELLISKGADVNVRNTVGDTHMDIAVRRNRRAIVQLLIAKGVDVSLPVAVRFEALAKVKSLIEDGADVDIRDESGEPVLHCAIERGRGDILKVLADKGANVNATDRYGRTPLHVVALEHPDMTLEMVELLIAKGANLNARDGDNRTPLWYARDEGQTQLAELLRKHGAKE